MKVGIIGCGYIGKKRAASIHGDNRLTACCDVDIEKAREVAGNDPSIMVTDNYKKLIDEADIDAVIIATLNYLLAPIALYAVQHGKSVLMEKPGAIASAELEPIMDKIKDTDIKVMVGFNHRYHPAFLKAWEIFNRPETGEVMFIRGRYGHGGRVGYNKEWRADKKLSGGGETMDQGVHLIDLARWFLGEFTTVEGFAANYFWNMPVDDNGFMSLRNAAGNVAWLQVSCTEWKNMFSFEIYCKYAKLEIEGLGGSYGTEKLKHYQMLPEMGPPETTIYEYPMGDHSWEREFDDFTDAVDNHRPLRMNDVRDAYETLKIVEKIYKNR